MAPPRLPTATVPLSSKKEGPATPPTSHSDHPGIQTTQIVRAETIQQDQSRRPETVTFA